MFKSMLLYWAPYLMPLPAWVTGAEFRELSIWALPTLPFI